MSSSGSGSGSGGYGGGGGKIRPLYGVVIEEALASNDTTKMKAALEQAKQQLGGATSGPVMALYGVVIHRCIEQGSSPEELRSLLEQAKAVKNSDLDGAIRKLEAHLSGKH